MSWTELPPADWGERQAKSIADEVKRMRGKNSAQWLADRTKAFGYEVTRSVISDLENGRRRYVTTAELIALAAALDTSPVNLMYPGPYDRVIECPPDVDAPEFDVVQWFCGNAYRGGSPAEVEYRDLGGDAVVAWHANTNSLRLYRLLGERLLSRSRALEDITRNPDAPAVPLLWEQVAMYDRMIHDLKQELGMAEFDA